MNANCFLLKAKTSRKLAKQSEYLRRIIVESGKKRGMGKHSSPTICEVASDVNVSIDKLQRKLNLT